MSYNRARTLTQMSTIGLTIEGIMNKTLRAFFLGFFCIFACIDNARPHAVHITFNTLKSDLDLLLKDRGDTSTVNIQYSEGAILHISFLPKPEATHGKYVKIDGIVNIKLKDGRTETVNDMHYINGSFGLPSSQEDTSYIVIDENPRVEIKPAEKTIQYVPLTKLTEDLNTARKSYGWRNIYNTFYCPNYRLGASSNILVYDWPEGYLRLTRPLKGITLGAEQQIEKYFSNWYKPGNPCKSSRLERSFSIEQSKTPDVFFDVWFAIGTKRYGSSTGSLGCVDAIRVYDEWSQDGGKQALTNTEEAENRGDKIRERVFEQDMDIAYKRLHDRDNPSKNVIINYANQIVLDVRGHTVGGFHFVDARGTTKANNSGSKMANVKVYYDPEKLKYSDQVATEETFVPGNFGEESFYLKYIDWTSFEGHLRAIWAAMQGKCAQKKLIYDFSLLYGDSTRVKYDCLARSVVVTDAILVLTDLPGLKKGAISKCRKLRYMDNHQIEMPDIGSDATPIAIQQQGPEILWTKSDEKIILEADIFNEEMRTMRETLIKNEKSAKMPDKGTIILDDDMLFKMEIPEGISQSHPNFVVVSGNFQRKELQTAGYKQEQKLFFNGNFLTSTDGMRTIVSIFTETKYLPFKYYLEDEYVIASKYLRVETLQNYLGTISQEVLRRCTSTKIKFSFKLVLHHSFELQGFYDCSETVFLTEGKFEALLNTQKDGKLVRSNRVIDNFLYIVKERLLVGGSSSFKDVYAISIPKATESWEDSREAFGAPIFFDDNSFLLLSLKKV